MIPRTVLDFPVGSTRASALELLRRYFEQHFLDLERAIQTDVLLDVEAGDDGFDMDDLDALLVRVREQKAGAIESALRQAAAVLDTLERGKSRRP